MLTTFPCRPNRPLPKLVYEYEYIDSGSEGVALPNYDKEPSYMTANEVAAHALPLPLRKTRRWTTLMRYYTLRLTRKKVKAPFMAALAML